MGHATRCIPIINALIEANYTPVIGSDGDALELLQKEFPNLKSYTLLPYKIRYTKNSKLLKLKLLFSMPNIILEVKKERKLVEKIVRRENIEGVISDNRFGVYSKNIPSVYLTHQVNVLSGITTYFTSKIHQRIIKKFDECWVPDLKEELNLSGKLGHPKKPILNLKYLGVLSRFEYQKEEVKYDLLVLLSGPEPQRSLLENKLIKELKNFKGKVLFVRGVLSKKSKNISSTQFKIINYLLSDELEKVINQSEFVLARSGYSTIMDLAALGKKAFFIPTPGQFEQEYLAKQLQEKLIAPYATQQNFKLTNLNELENYSGFKRSNTSINLNLFSLFNGKRKF